VAYSFDGGTVFTQTWLESDDFDALIHPGLTNLARKNFAVLIAASRTFGFGFTEFQGSAKATIFRVTGMAGAIAPSLAACPGNGVVTGLDGVQMLRELQGAGEQSGAEAAVRRAWVHRRPARLSSSSCPCRARRRRYAYGRGPR
jgi:hypothetical protein